MTTSAVGPGSAFSRLSRDLTARRLATLDFRARAVVLAIVVLISGFAYWQVRVPLDGVHRAHGAVGALEMLAAVLGVFALASGSIAAWRQIALLARVPGPEWLALPVPPALVLRHLLSESRLFAYGMFGPALAAVGAGVGFMPPLWLALLFAAFIVAWLESTRWAAALARRVTLPRTHGSLPAATRLLLASERAARARPLPAAKWVRESSWRALLRLDVLASGRAGVARSRLLWALGLFAIGLVAWIAPGSAGHPTPALLRQAQAFVAFAAGSAALGAWAIARACADPPSATRPLPLSLADVWRARALALLAGLGALVLLNALLASALPLGGRIGLVVTWWPPAAAIAILGLHYGITLQPRASVAENLYFGWLGVALAASVMIPFLGWGVMIAGLIHSGLRLRRWWHPEVA